MSSPSTISCFNDYHEFSGTGNEYISTVLQLVFPDLQLSKVHDNIDIPSNVLPLLLHCPWCKTTAMWIQRIGERTSTHHIYCCSTLYCYDCHNQWYLCAGCSVGDMYPLLHGKGGCSRTATHMRKKKFTDHVQWHKKIPDVNVEETCLQSNGYKTSDNEGADFMTDINTEDIIDVDESIRNKRNWTVTNIRQVFDNAETSHVGEFMIHEVDSRASNHIIQQSIMGISFSSTGKDISSNDSLLYMLLMLIGTHMSREERNKLANLTYLIQHKVEEETLIGQGLIAAYHARIPLPVSSYDMRKIFESGRQQFMNFMPVPIIYSPIAGYASVSLVKTLQVIYSRGYNWDNKNYQSFHNCEIGSFQTERSILEGQVARDKTIRDDISDVEGEETIVMQLIIAWSDSADLNKVKNNRSLIKVHNIYIPHIDGQSPHCVFPLAIGTGKSAHGTYRKRMFDELNLLHKDAVTCVDMTIGRVIQVRFFLLAAVQDRPKHSEFTGTIGHNGKYGALPGYSFPRSICIGSFPAGVSTLKDLVSCKDCYLRRINYLCRKDDRDRTMDSNSVCDKCYDWNVTQVQFQRPPKMPKDIPANCYVNGDTGNTILRSNVVSFQSIKDCLQYIHEKTYRKDWTEFLKTVHSFASLQCVNISLAKKVYDSAKMLRKIHIRNEGHARDETPPMNHDLLPSAILSPNLSMDQCMVGIMHTFFLNGGKKIITLLHDVFKKEKCGTGFLTKSNFIYRDLHNLSLSWIMAWPFGSTSDKPTAPWVSENFVAYYHICKSHTSIVCERLILKGRGSVAASLKLMIRIWHRLLSIVMQPKYPTNKDVSVVNQLSKLFLSGYHEFETYLERPTKDWDLQNSSCHLMLLLLPDYMKRFECLRNYWEGGHTMGERSITKLKRSLPHGAHLDGSVRTAIHRYFIDVA